MAIAMELRRRGHDPIIATSAFYRDKIEAEGIAFAAVRPDIPDFDAHRDVMQKVFDLRNGPEYLIRQMVMPHLRDSYDDLATAAADADLLVAHPLTFAARLVAEKRGLPWVSSILAPMGFFSVHDPPVLPPVPGFSRLRPLGPALYGPLFRLMRNITRSWTEAVPKLREELGLPPSLLDPMYEGQFSPLLNLALFSSVLGAPQPDWPANTLVTGFPFYDRLDREHGLPPALNAFLDAGPAPVVFTLGSSAVADAGDFYAQSAEAARIMGWRAVLLVGRDPRNRPAMLPDTIAAFEYAPYSDLFPRAAAVVHQGGVGTTGQTLRAGRPMLVVPYGFDQPDNGERAARLGVAKVIPRLRYAAGPAAKALEALLSDPACMEKARGLGQIVRGENGASVACDRLERVIAG